MNEFEYIYDIKKVIEEMSEQELKDYIISISDRLDNDPEHLILQSLLQISKERLARVAS